MLEQLTAIAVCNDPAFIDTWRKCDSDLLYLSRDEQIEITRDDSGRDWVLPIG